MLAFILLPVLGNSSGFSVLGLSMPGLFSSPESFPNPLFESPPLLASPLLSESPPLISFKTTSENSLFLLFISFPSESKSLIPILYLPSDSKACSKVNSLDSLTPKESIFSSFSKTSFSPLLAKIFKVTFSKASLLLFSTLANKLIFSFSFICL